MSDIHMIRVGNLEIGKGIPKICVPVTGRTKEEIIVDTNACAAVSPDLVEWRCDFFDEVNDHEAVKDVLKTISGILGQIPIIFTFRSSEEGGDKPINLEDYVNLILMVSKTDYVQIVDVEFFKDPDKMKTLICQIHKQDKFVIGSHHRFDCTPAYSDMLDIFKALDQAGADIPKLAVMPSSDVDVRNLMLAVNEVTCDFVKRPVIAMSMGAFGVKSRVCGELFGSCITFGCVGKASAPGQVPVDQLRLEMESLHKIVENISK